MITIEGTTITMPCGDTLEVPVLMNFKHGGTYTPQAGDQMKFALKRPKMNTTKTDYKDRVPIVEKNIPINTQILKLEPTDTSLPFGSYVYDIQLIYANGTVDTFINEATLNIRPNSLKDSYIE